jgi:LmbE family N-acetylglucosaminyl deacetylase
MFTPSLKNLTRVLCLGSHADDIEIGCGGTVLRLLKENPGLEVWWVVLSGNPERAQEAQQSAAAWLDGAGQRQVICGDFRDRYFPAQWAEIKDFIHGIAAKVDPDLIFTQRRDDAHQDHRLLGELTWNAFRNHLIWEYEIPKFEGDLGQPNVFLSLDEATCRQKIQLLGDSFPSQQSKPWFTADAFWALLRLRGLECNSPSRFAEGFYARKTLL